MNNKAIFTIVFGERYVQNWEKYCKPGWTKYAEKHGYDLVVVDGPIRKEHDFKFRPIHWQKLFVPQHPRAKDYESIVFLDSDIMINYHHAPCIVRANNCDKVGAVRFDKYIDDPFLYHHVFIRKQKYDHYGERYRQKQNGPSKAKIIGPNFNRLYSDYTDRNDLPLINTGVLVFKPGLHKELFEKIYFDSVDEVKNIPKYGNIEQEYISFKLIDADALNFIDERFNRIAAFEYTTHYPFCALGVEDRLKRTCCSTILANCYFMHFAGFQSLMEFTALDERGDFTLADIDNIYEGDVEICGHRINK